MITEVHGRVIVGTTKTQQRRSVPIPRFLANELAVELATKVPGDLVFTGTPAGVGPVIPGDLLVGRIEGLGLLSVRIAPPR